MTPAPLAGLDRSLAAPRSALVRVLAWAATNYVLFLLAVPVAYLLVAVPPLSLLPSAEPLSLQDHLLAVVYGTFGWPLHLLVVAAVSRTRRARLWVVLASPLLSVVVLGLVYLGLGQSHTLRYVVLAWTLYAVVCRLLPPARRAPSTADPVGPPRP